MKNSFSLKNLTTKIKFKEHIVHIFFDLNFNCEDDYYDIQIPKSFIKVEDQYVPTDVYYDEEDSNELNSHLSHYIDTVIEDKEDLNPKKVNYFLNYNGIKEYTITKKSNTELKENKSYSEPLVSYFKTIYKHHGGRKSSIASIISNSIIESSNRYYEDTPKDSSKLIDMIIERLNQLKG